MALHSLTLNCCWLDGLLVLCTQLPSATASGARLLLGSCWPGLQTWRGILLCSSPEFDHSGKAVIIDRLACRHGRCHALHDLCTVILSTAQECWAALQMRRGVTPLHSRLLVVPGWVADAGRQHALLVLCPLHPIALSACKW